MAVVGSFKPLMHHARQWIDQDLIHWQKERNWSSDFSEALKHVVLGAGKAFRPALCFWIAQSLSRQSLGSRPSPSLVRLGLSLELMHTYSLVHDDLPAMDNDAFRRGRPTLHVLKGEAFAVLAGDALLTASFETLAEAFVGDVEKLPLAVQILAQASGASGMIEGQWRDLCSTALPIEQAQLSTLESIHDLKTGALLAASVSLGALSALSLGQFRERRKVFHEWGLKLGRLFQMVDDYLDVTASSSTLGKTSGKDQIQGKLTYPALLGLQECGERIEELRKSLLQWDLGVPSGDLENLLDFVARRQS